jgi:hypothetical protein
VGIVGVALVAGVVALAVAGPVRLIQMPDGVWLRVRAPGAVKVTGGQYRYFVWGTDAVARKELDTDGDGRYDVRGDDWQRVVPKWCWLRGASGWEPAAPERCAAASDQLLQGHP